jgi:hypothetical protein
MALVDKLRGMFRRRPLTDDELRARAEAKVIREQMLQDKLSQGSGGGSNYRSGGR